jgi:hypothetical protein
MSEGTAGLSHPLECTYMSTGALLSAPSLAAIYGKTGWETLMRPYSSLKLSFTSLVVCIIPRVRLSKCASTRLIAFLRFWWGGVIFNKFLQFDYSDNAQDNWNESYGGWKSKKILIEKETSKAIRVSSMEIACCCSGGSTTAAAH